MKIIGLCVGLLIGFGACQSHRDTVVGIRAEGIPVPRRLSCQFPILLTKFFRILWG